MSIAKQVHSYIVHQRYGRVFSLDDFLKVSNLESRKVAVVAAFRRCISDKLIVRLSPGMYYKPKKSRFGYLPVDTQELIKAYSRKKRADYVISGASAANALGISTQLPMVRSYIMTERVRAELKTVNIKIEYSKALSYFSQHLKVSDKEQKEKAMLFWSALHYIDKDRFEEYSKELSSCFDRSLNDAVKVKFLKALPPSMAWARNRLTH
ncbi:TPA: DUF6088 family protein [Vibrio diabolicus]|uniref:DUF6088 family protein n=1 Tax=Vibrio diabolicus TaxID=50719 RepID=UPI00215F5589|nr:DUF6088 family protein [Vibrio diabolicus]MCS0391477.1 DUF6088 family protein [Vibrio diabolicus]